MNLELNQIKEDHIFLFIISYLYNLNFKDVLRLYELSSDLFKAYLYVMQPTLRISKKKLVFLKLQANRLYNILKNNNFVERKTRDSDLKFLNLLNQHIKNIFADQYKYLTLEQLQGMTICRITENDTVLPLTYEELSLNLDKYDRIIVNGHVLSRTSPIRFLINKYFTREDLEKLGNMGLSTIHELVNSHVSERESEEEVH